MSKKFHFVYQTKNIVNGKTYIGVHSTNNLSDGYIGSGITSQTRLEKELLRLKAHSYFLRAVYKHGYDNFKVEILNFYNTSEEAFEEERFLVDESWVKDESNYNTALGGSGGCLPKDIKIISINRAGDTYYFDNVIKAATKLAIHTAGIRQALKKDIISYKGWVFLSPGEYDATTFKFPTGKHDKYIGLKMLSPEGTVHTLETSLAIFCRKYDIRPENIYQIFNGEVEQIKGWRVLSKEFIKIPFRVKTLKFEGQAEDISTYLKQGLTPYKIAQLLNTSPGCIKSVIKKLNL